MCNGRHLDGKESQILEKLNIQINIWIYGSRLSETDFVLPLKIVVLKLCMVPYRIVPLMLHVLMTL